MGVRRLSAVSVFFHLNLIDIVLRFIPPRAYTAYTYTGYASAPQLGRDPSYDYLCIYGDIQAVNSDFHANFQPVVSVNYVFG